MDTEPGKRSLRRHKTFRVGWLWSREQEARCVGATSNAMNRAFAVGRGMLAMRPNVGVSSSSLVAGHTLRLDNGQKAAVLCWRGGLCFAALPPGAELAGECDVTHEPGKAFALPAGDTLGGRIIDCLGSPMDGGPTLRADAPQWPLLGPVPEASALTPINRLSLIHI